MLRVIALLLIGCALSFGGGFAAARATADEIATVAKSPTASEYVVLSKSARDGMLHAVIWYAGKEREVFLRHGDCTEAGTVVVGRILPTECR